MVDFTRMIVRGKGNIKILSSAFNRWKLGVWNDDGEVSESETKFRNFTFEKKSNDFAFISGSLHTFLHGHNYTQFNYLDLCDSIDQLCGTIGIPSNELHLTKLEFGVNLNLPYPVDSVLDRLIMHGIKPFTDMQEQYGVTLGKYAQHRQYRIKVYDKGLHFKLLRSLLRLEIAVEKMQFIQRKCKNAIKTLGDLKNRDLLQELGVILRATFDEILIEENLRFEEMSKREKEVYEFGRHFKNWNRLYKKNVNTYKSRKKKFKEIQNMYLADSRTDDLKRQIGQTWGSLLHPVLPPSEAVELHPVLPLELPSPKNLNFTLFYPLYKYVNLGEFSPRELQLIRDQKCAVCTSDISHKKTGSITCCKEHRNRLSNFYNNPLRPIKKSIRNRQLFLFQLKDFLVLGSLANSNRKRETGTQKVIALQNVNQLHLFQV